MNTVMIIITKSSQSEYSGTLVRRTLWIIAGNVHVSEAIFFNRKLSVEIAQTSLKYQ